MSDAPGGEGAGAHADLEAFLAALALDAPFEAHERLEAAWRRLGDPLARVDAAQALIQVAAAYVHRARGNDVGARHLARQAAERLERPCPPAADAALSRSGVERATLARRLRALPPDPAAWPPALAVVAPGRGEG